MGNSLSLAGFSGSAVCAIIAAIGFFSGHWGIGWLFVILTIILAVIAANGSGGPH